MKEGDRVRFIAPTEDEEGVIFQIIEDRDDRVLVSACELFDDWAIRPTSVYQKSDLELVSETKN